MHIHICIYVCTIYIHILFSHHRSFNRAYVHLYVYISNSSGHHSCLPNQYKAWNLIHKAKQHTAYYITKNNFKPFDKGNRRHQQLRYKSLCKIQWVIQKVNILWMKWTVKGTTKGDWAKQKWKHKFLNVRVNEKAFQRKTFT